MLGMSGFLCGSMTVGRVVFLWCSVWLLESVVPLWDSVTVEMSDSQTVNFGPSDETRLAAWSRCLYWRVGGLASCLLRLNSIVWFIGKFQLSEVLC